MGSAREKKKQHLITWDRVCLPKREGGLGIRKTSDMNKALLAKVGWRVMHGQATLWVRVVRSKYKVGDIHDHNWTVAKSTWSSTWQIVGVGIREVIHQGQSWVIGDGKEINFWMDKWLLERPLTKLVIRELPEGVAHMKARELWFDGRGWNFPCILPYVMDTRRLELSAVVVDSVTRAKDRLSSGETPYGKFTVKSAYTLLTRDERLRKEMGQFFQRLWRVMVSERVRVFLWLIGNQAIMTNHERYRRHLGIQRFSKYARVEWSLLYMFFEISQR